MSVLEWRGIPGVLEGDLHSVIWLAGICIGSRWLGCGMLLFFMLSGVCGLSAIKLNLNRCFHLEIM